MSRHKPVKNPIATCIFIFLTKQRRFDFFIKKIDPDNSMTRSKPGESVKTPTLNRAGHLAGFKNYEPIYAGPLSC
jgi:hypothetical protein